MLEEDTEEAREAKLNGDTEDRGGGGQWKKWPEKKASEESPEQRYEPQIGKAVSLTSLSY
eukprot:10676280-Ditylum_brightwellii.AAC.1